MGRIVLPKIRERDVEHTISDLVKSLGGLRYHTFDSRKSEKGFPDDVIIVRDLLCFWELKTKTGKESDDQLKWLEALRNVKRIDVRTVRPEDLQFCVDILTGRFK